MTTITSIGITMRMCAHTAVNFYSIAMRTIVLLFLNNSIQIIARESPRENIQYNAKRFMLNNNNIGKQQNIVLNLSSQYILNVSKLNPNVYFLVY